MQRFVDSETPEGFVEASPSLVAVEAAPYAAPLPVDRRRRVVFRVYLAFVAVYSIWIGAAMAREIDSWIIGDWLINYSGGFVRRGLAGAVVMLMHRSTGVPLQWVVFGIAASFFLVFITGVYQLTKGIRWSYPMMALLLSPATLAFMVLGGHEAGLRKEVVLFATLATTVWVLMSGRCKDWQVSVMLSAFLVGLTLSHEAMLVAVPYFFAAVAIQTMSLRRTARICAVPIVLCGIASVAVILHHGDPRAAQAICQSVGGTLGTDQMVAFHPIGGLCGGSIYWMQLNVAQGRELIAPAIREWQLGRLFAMLAVSTFAPVVALLYVLWRRDRLRYEVGVVVACALVSLIGMGGLFYVGIDWGRWLHLEAVCLMLLAIMVERKAAAATPEEERAKRPGLKIRVVASAVVFVYATLWTLPGVGNEGEDPGYLAMVWPTYRMGLHDLHVSVINGVRKTMRR